MNDDTFSADTLDILERAEQLKLSGQHEEALSMLEDLLSSEPDNVAALEEIADNEVSMERFDRAEKAAKQAISMDSESYTGWYILGFLSSQKEKWDMALEELTMANSLKSNNPEILRCLGWVLFSSGKRTQGIVTLERALNLESNNPLTLCDLGVAYLQARNFTKAKALFMRALDVDPGNVRAQECVQAVERLEQSMRSSHLQA